MTLSHEHLKPGQQPVSKFSVLAVCSLGAVLTQIMGSAINIAMPDIQAEFHMRAVTLAWIQTSFLLATAVCMLPAGRLADIFGRKKIYMTGMIVYTIASAACALSFSGGALIVFRILQGLGSALIFATGMAMLTSAFQPGERGRAIGMAVASAYIGLAVGPVIGGVLTQQFGWRSVFWSVTVLSIFCVVLMVIKIKTEWIEAGGEAFDIGGSLIYAVALVMLMLGLNEMPDFIGVGLLAAGLSGLIVFFYWEKTNSNPILNISLFSRNRVFALSSLVAMINYCATFALIFLLSLYLQYIKAKTPQSASVVLVIFPVTMAVVSPITGRLSDRTAPAITASTGMAVMGLSILRLAFLNETSGEWGLMVNLGLLGIGSALFLSPNTNAIVSSVETRYLGIASGAVATMRLLGQVISMGIAGLIFSIVMGNATITPDLYPLFLVSMRIAFWIFALLCFIGALIGVYLHVGPTGMRNGSRPTAPL